MTPDERRQLADALAAVDRPHPLTDPRLRRRRRFGVLFMTACCIGLAAWIGILLLTLPGRYTSSDWRGAWVGLDIAELAGFAATAWAAWHQRQLLIFFMIITGTLLVCDAWFDVALDYGSRDFTMSLVSALVVELPLALLLVRRARPLVRVTIATMMQVSGVPGHDHPRAGHRPSALGAVPARALRRDLAPRAARRDGRARSGRTRRDLRLPVDGSPGADGEPGPGRTRRVPPARGVRLRLQGDRRHHRQDRSR